MEGFWRKPDEKEHEKVQASLKSLIADRRLLWVVITVGIWFVLMIIAIACITEGGKNAYESAAGFPIGEEPSFHKQEDAIIEEIYGKSSKGNIYLVMGDTDSWRQAKEDYEAQIDYDLVDETMEAEREQFEADIAAKKEAGLKAQTSQKITSIVLTIVLNLLAAGIIYLVFYLTSLRLKAVKEGKYTICEAEIYERRSVSRRNYHRSFFTVVLPDGQREELVVSSDIYEAAENYHNVRLVNMDENEGIIDKYDVILL